MSPGRFYFDDADEEQDFHNPHEADCDREDADADADDNPHGGDADENLSDNSDSEL